MRRSVHCVLALRCVLALYCVVSIVLRLSVALYSSVVFSVVFLQAFSVLLLHPYLRCVRSAALVAKVYPLATVSGLLITRASWQYCTVWLAERCRGGFVCVCVPRPLPSIIIIIILVIPWFRWFSLLLLLLLLFGFSLILLASTESLSVWLVPMLVFSYFVLFVPALGRGLVAGLWLLLATGVVPSCRAWVARQ